jgi:hypothetical protein
MGIFSFGSIVSGMKLVISVGIPYAWGKHARLLHLGWLVRSSTLLATQEVDEVLDCQPDLLAKVGEIDRVPDGLEIRPPTCRPLYRVHLGIGAVVGTGRLACEGERTTLSSYMPSP